MNKISALLIWILSALVLCPSARAFESLAIAYSGAVAEKIDLTGRYYGGFDGGYMGGPAANNSLGGAYEFKTLEALYVDHLKVDARVWSFNRTGLQEFAFDWKLYGSTVLGEYGAVPDQQDLLVASQMTVQTNEDPLEYNQLTGVEVPINRTLQPGTYWLARERELGRSGPIVDNIKTDFYGNKMATAHTPDPITCVTFGGGIAWAIWRKRRGHLTGKG